MSRFRDEFPPFRTDARPGRAARRAHRKALRAAWRAWAATQQFDALHGVEAVIPPPFDPYNGLFGLYPTLNPSGMPVLGLGSTGPYVAYMQGVLYFKANQPCRPAANPNDWGFGPITASCVVSFKRFFGIIPAWSTNSTVNAATWSAIQYCANNL